MASPASYRASLNSSACKTRNYQEHNTTCGRKKKTKETATNISVESVEVVILSDDNPHSDREGDLTTHSPSTALSQHHPNESDGDPNPLKVMF